MQKDPVEATLYLIQLHPLVGSLVKLTTARTAAVVDLAAVVRKMQHLVVVLPTRAMPVALAGLVLPKLETVALVLHRQLQVVL
jgi:hypothetical protein